MSLYKRGETWWYDLTVNGQRVRESTGSQDRQEAQRIHDKVRADLWDRKPGPGHLLSDALVIWLKAKPRTKREKNATAQLLELYPDRDIRLVNGSDIYRALLCKEPAWANRIASIPRSALNMAHKAGWCDQVHIPKREEPAGRIRWITREEWATLYEKLPKHLKPMALFSISTGLRWSNVSDLKWAQVNFSAKSVSIEAPDMKARRATSIPLSDTAIEALEAVKGKHQIYCFTYGGKKIGSPKKGLASACEAAEIEDFTWHDFRHTWASWHVQAGTPLAVLKELGAWATMDMVLRYAHLAPNHIAEWASNVTIDTHNNRAPR